MPPDPPQRPPRRPPRPQFKLAGRLTPAVMWLLCINVATFLLFSFSGKPAKASLVEWLILTPSSLLDGHVWKLVTTTVFTSSPLAFFLDVLVLFLFMPFLEREWGTRRFLRFALITSVVGNLVAAGIGLLLGSIMGGVYEAIPIAGLSPFVYGALIGYGVQFGDRQVQFFGVLPMKGRTLAIGIAAVVVLAALINGNWVEGGGHIAAMIAAFFLTTRDFTPRLWLLQWRRARLRKRYTVLDGGRGEGQGKKQWLN